MFSPLRIVALVALTGALFAAKQTPPETAAQAAGSQPRCLNLQLHITSGPSNGFTGHVVRSYRIHNMWGSACTLTGYPGIQLLDGSFHDLPTHLRRGGLVFSGRQSPSTVSVAGHGNASFGLVYQDIPNGKKGCSIATYLMIIPPNDYLPVVSYAGQSGAGVRACAGELVVSPVTAGNVGL